MTSRSVKLVASVPAALRPSFTGTSWRPAAISARNRKKLMWDAIRAGTFDTSVTSLEHGWNPDWNLERLSVPTKPNSLNKRQRTQASRVAKIEEGLTEATQAKFVKQREAALEGKRLQTLGEVYAKTKLAHESVFDVPRHFKKKKKKRKGPPVKPRK